MAFGITKLVIDLTTYQALDSWRRPGPGNGASSVVK